MKAAMVILLFALGSIECRKIVLTINKNANVDFINMEGGGHSAPSTPIVPTGGPLSLPPGPPRPKTSTSPVKPAVTAKPVPVVVPVTQLPTQMDLKPVQPGKPSGSAITTPGPGNVKQLVTFYDSQGKASGIRPYSYSDAVKKGQA